MIGSRKRRRHGRRKTTAAGWLQVHRCMAHSTNRTGPPRCCGLWVCPQIGSSPYLPRAAPLSPPHRPPYLPPPRLPPFFHPIHPNRCALRACGHSPSPSPPLLPLPHPSVPHLRRFPIGYSPLGTQPPAVHQKGASLVTLFCRDPPHRLEQRQGAIGSANGRVAKLESEEQQMLSRQEGNLRNSCHLT